MYMSTDIMFHPIRILILSLFTCIHFSLSAPAANSTNGDVTQCLKNFYQSAYDKELNCTNDLELFSEIPLIQQTSFVLGKSCFLEFAKDECSAAQYNLLNTKYDQFLDVITNSPVGDKVPCINPYFRYNALKCGPMMNDFDAKGIAVNAIDTKINDSRILELITMCDKIMRCLAPPCYSTESAINAFKDNCLVLQVKNSELMNCNNKLKKQSPDLSDYPCLGGISFSNGNIKDGIELLTEKKECTKEVMKDFCGEKVLVHFDEMAALLLENMKRTDKLREIANYQE